MLFFFFASLFCLAISTCGQGLDIPIQRHKLWTGNSVKRANGRVSGVTGLGDNSDVLYTVPIKLGDSVTAVNLDTGSSDLWVVTDKCQAGACMGASVGRYTSAKAKSSGLYFTLLYGDSSTGTFASGTVGLDSASVATIAMADQPFGMINSTNNRIVQYQAAGIFGLGFPSGSEIQEARVIEKFGPIETTDDLIRATYTDGPLVARMALTGELEQPMFSVTLQRNTIDIGGAGRLTIGNLPDGVVNSSMTWVPVRLYSTQDGGVASPTFAPDEEYPFRWEIDIEGVFLDGQRIADSLIPPNGVEPDRVTALIDTGNSILRGPQDMVNNILQTVSPGYNPANTDMDPPVPCAVPHTLAFQIGGKMFPVDPRDLISPQMNGDTTNCIVDNLVATDPPKLGTLYRWSLGAPFMKSNLVAFYYGNLTHPSVDPPRIGFLSTVPQNANELLKQVAQDAKNAGGSFEQTLVVAPTASAAAQPQLTLTPVAPVDFQPSQSSPASTSQGGLNKHNASLTVSRNTAADAFVLLVLLVSLFS